jgi:hypothetical protein
MWSERSEQIASKMADKSAEWQSSDDICAFADNERHLGHVVRTDKWQAYDATKLNPDQTGFRYLGAFASVVAAREAVETSVISTPVELVRTAGG